MEARLSGCICLPQQSQDEDELQLSVRHCHRLGASSICSTILTLISTNSQVVVILPGSKMAQEPKGLYADHIEHGATHVDKAPTTNGNDRPNPPSPRPPATSPTKNHHLQSRLGTLGTSIQSATISLAYDAGSLAGLEACRDSLARRIGQRYLSSAERNIFRREVYTLNDYIEDAIRDAVAAKARLNEMVEEQEGILRKMEELKMRDEEGGDHGSLAGTEDCGEESCDGAKKAPEPEKEEPEHEYTTAATCVGI
ncbi:hypothetical protein GE09DRAFT_728325 [Coniochaeta sp. 2T2.1]|nr:hypothetical protein GE09DRAFT_728325 [Coniochaeta sp. 2T2.1]